MSRKACCLCEEAEAAVFHVVEKCEYPTEAVEVVDVDQQLELAARFGADVPVVLIDGIVKMKHVVDQTELEGTLLAMLGEQTLKESESC